MNRCVLACLSVAVLLVVAPGTTAARQAISVSLAECSAIFDEMTRFTSAGSTAERRAKAARGAAVFRDAAVHEARREGAADAEAHVRSWLVRHGEKWDGRFQKLSLLSENKDWIDYCRSLGEDRGILPLKE